MSGPRKWCQVSGSTFTRSGSERRDASSAAAAPATGVHGRYSIARPAPASPMRCAHVRRLAATRSSSGSITLVRIQSGRSTSARRAMSSACASASASSVPTISAAISKQRIPLPASRAATSSIDPPRPRCAASEKASGPNRVNPAAAAASICAGRSGSTSNHAERLKALKHNVATAVRPPAIAETVRGSYCRATPSRSCASHRAGATKSAPHRGEIAAHAGRSERQRATWNVGASGRSERKRATASDVECRSER